MSKQSREANTEMLLQLGIGAILFFAGVVAGLLLLVIL
jgi:hypothetical protein